MEENMSKSKRARIIGRVGIFIGTLLLLFLLCKFAFFFMPFLIAAIIAIAIEPVIKFCMNKLKMSRRVSSFIIITLTIVILGFVVVWGTTELISELLKLTSNIAPAITKATDFVNVLTDKITVEYADISPQVINAVEKSVVDFIGNFGTYIGEVASQSLKMLLSIPTIAINIIITILALIFFTKDRIYVIDLLEHHFPKAWIKNTTKVLNEIFASIGGYIKVYLKIIVITFTELFLAFNIFNWIGFDVPYPFGLALVIALLDILPVLGVGTVLNPWAVWMLIEGNYGFAAAIFITYVIIFCVRQFIEPKLVSNQFGIHPIITLMAMYAGYKLIGGVFGLIAGPIALMALRCIFAKQIERGLFKDLFDEK